MPPHPELIKRLKQEGRWERFIHKFPTKPAGLDTPAPTKAPVIGVRKAIVLLVDFSDNIASTSQSHYVNLLFSSGTYPTGSMRDYYQEVSYNQLDIQGEVTGWYRAPQLYSYYTNGSYGFGSYPRNAQRLTEDTVNLADPFVNFANYDNDGDTYVDALFIVHAGPGAEVTGNPNDIWSHKWVTSYVMNVDGVKVHTYSMEPEDGKIGVFSHELGHVFGLPDLYDYEYDSQGIGNWGLMASGSWGGGGTRPVHPCAWSKIALGWVTPIVPTTNQNTVLFPHVETNQVIYKLWTNGTPANEYFLVENRQNVGFDESLPGNGLLIWHIDDNKPTNDEQWYPGLPPEQHYKVAVEPADGQWHLERNINYGDSGDPFPGSTNNTAFDNNSIPNSNAYLTGATNVGVTNISPSAMTMTADIQVVVTSYGLDVATDKTSYVLGDTIIGTVTAWNNTTNPIPVDVKIYVRCPTPLGNISLMNLPNVTLPPGFNYGPVTLINYTISSPLPTGTYSYEGRFLDVITGSILKQDIATFTYQ
jgi:immune inhibitor A